MTPPTILLTGATGQVGFELARALAPLGRVVAPPRAALDLQRPETLREQVRALRPSIVVNPAAYTAVDRAESERDAAWCANAVAPEVLADEARRVGALLVHFSTDYVFGGEPGHPWRETDAPAPLNVYGASKLAGEQAVAASGARHLVLRTSWVYGARGRNFLAAMLDGARSGRPTHVVDDQRGAPTPSRLLAALTAALVRHPRVVDAPDGDPLWGVYHVAAAGATTWHGFAAAIFAELARRGEPVPPLAPIRTADRPSPAVRPRHSVLDTTRLRDTFAVHLPPWDEQLALVLDERLGAPTLRHDA